MVVLGRRCSVRRMVWAICLSLVCLSGLSACGRSKGGNVSKTADGFLTSLVAEDFTAATSLLEPGYARKLTPGRLKQSWEIFRRTVGEFKRELGVRTENDPKGPIVAISCEFERRTMDLWLRFNSAGQIVDVRFVAPGKTPSSEKRQPAPPSSRPQDKGGSRRIAAWPPVVGSR